LATERSILGVILAGGRSARMGADKAFVDFGGRPLIAYAIETLTPQVGALAINANGDPTRFAAFGLPVFADAAGYAGEGPLAGIAAALAFAEAAGYAHLATIPCDAPFAPRDLVARLGAAIAISGAPVAVAEGPRGLEPLFGLWSTALRPAVEAALARGERSPRAFFAGHGAARAVFYGKDGADPFANLNDRQELAAAQIRLPR